MAETLVDVEYIKSIVLVVGVLFNVAIAAVISGKRGDLEGVIFGSLSKAKNMFNSANAATTAALIVALYVGLQMVTSGSMIAQVRDITANEDPESQPGKENASIGLNIFVGSMLLLAWVVASGFLTGLVTLVKPSSSSYGNEFSSFFGRRRRRKKC